MSESGAPSERVAAILDEYLQGLAEGRAPDRKALLAAHPEHADWLSAALDGLDFVHGAGRGFAGGGEADAEPGRALGDYRIVREVGRGGMAVVYEAEQVSLGRRVALKVLPFAAVLDPKQLQRFKNEALAAANLRHPNIVPVHAVGCERGVHYYAMQLVEGQSLAAAIRDVRGGGAGEGPRTPISSHGSNREPAYVRMAAALGVQAAEALDHAHQLGVVHRDVKPGNLLVDPAGTLWVTDFGLARSTHDAGLTMTGELLGTVRYMSPEQALAKRVPIDHRTDVYSLGATLYELFTLEPAFPGEDPHLVIQDIAFRDPVAPRKLNPSLPVDLETVLLKAMAKDPASRYATAQEMADDLGRFLEDRPVLARRPSPAARAVRWARRHRPLVAASVVVLLLGLAALAAHGFRLAQEQGRTEAALGTARANLGLARDAVNRFLVESQFAGVVECPIVLSDPQRALLGSALQFYRGVGGGPEDRTSVCNQSDILHVLERYEEALAVLDRLVAADPRDARALTERGHMLWHLGRHADALAAHDRALEVDPSLAPAHHQRGRALSSLGAHAAALDAYDRAARLDPSMTLFQRARGDALLALGRPAEALDAYDRALEIRPEFASHYNRAFVLTAMGRPAEALDALARAIALEPGRAEAHTMRGALLVRLHRNAEALDACDRAIALDPMDGRAHHNRSAALVRLGRPEEAVEACTRAIAIDPNDAIALSNRGLVLGLLGRNEEALADCDRAIAVDGKDPRAHFHRGLALWNLGRSGEALQAYDRAVALDPDEPDLRATLFNAVAWLRATCPDPELRDAPRAVEFARRAAELAPAEGTIWNTLGVAHCRAESWTDAREALGKSMELRKGGDAHDWFFVAMAEARLGRREEARRWYDRAVAWTEANAKGDAELARFRAEAAAALGAE